ncbi:unnamed protein product [Arctia plantaginis]|nr:unnamed protein product [Arctia plantaginis]
MSVMMEVYGSRLRRRRGMGRKSSQGDSGQSGDVGAARKSGREESGVKRAHTAGSARRRPPNRTRWPLRVERCRFFGRS